MAQAENEKVVNRFLLSTVYCFIAAIFTYYLYRWSVSSSMVMVMPNIYYLMMGLGGVLAVVFAVRHWALKKGSLYYFGLFLLVAVAGAFLQYYPKISFFFIAYRRFLVIGLVVALIYIEELIYYFLNVRKKTK